MQLSILNQENFIVRLEIFYYKNWSQVFENVFFLVPLSILTIARRGKGSGGPGCDIRTRRSILYRIDAGKTESIFLLQLCFPCILSLIVSFELKVYSNSSFHIPSISESMCDN
jgi:hypothetical protein